MSDLHVRLFVLPGLGESVSTATVNLAENRGRTFAMASPRSRSPPTRWWSTRAGAGL